tara:strand:- start:10506 stop:11270 length:765 start_codon:yes stop_codon:yes gene_type:complete
MSERIVKCYDNIFLVRFPKCASSFFRKNLKDRHEILGYAEAQYNSGVDGSTQQLKREAFWYNLLVFRGMVYPDKLNLPLPPPYASSNWLYLSCIRHPIDRLFSALYFSHAVYLSRGHDTDSFKNSFDELDIESKIIYFLKKNKFPSKVYELSSCNPGGYSNYLELLKGMDLVMVQEDLTTGLSILRDKWGIKIDNKRYGGSSEEAYQEAFNTSPEDEKQKLKEKYWEALLPLYEKDIKVYEYFVKKNEYQVSNL